MRPRDELPHFDDEDERPSRSSFKREAQALQELGEAIVELTDGELATLPLDGDLAEAIAQARRLKSQAKTREGFRRQLQYIGKLMRRVDPGPIRAVLDERRAGARAEAAVFRRVESWRERLLNDPDSLAHLLAEHPSADPSRLRALVESARRERVEAGAPHSYKELFRALRELLGRYTPGP